MDDDLRERVEEWIEFLGPGLVASLPTYAEVREALLAGEWARADDAILGTPFARTADGLSLRALIADVRGDRATLGEVALGLEFRERPDVKLWALRKTGRTSEAAALVRGAWPEFRRDAAVLREGLASAWIESDWTLFLSLSEALEVLATLDAEQWAARGWALEKRRRVPEAVAAYLHAYRDRPSPWVSRRFLMIAIDRDHADQEDAIYNFVAEANVEGAIMEPGDDPWMEALAVGEHFHRGRSLRGLRAAFRLVGRMVGKAVRRSVARLSIRFGRRKREPRPGFD